MEQVSIEMLKKEDLQEAAKVVGRAFGPTPFAMAACRVLEKSERFLETTVKIMFERFPGQVLVARKDNRVVGVMRMVEWPECQMSSSQERMILPSMFSILGFGIIRYKRGKSVWTKHHPKEPHFHLDHLAVMPEMQGRGVGSQLLEHVCMLVDGKSMPAYLEADSSENVRLYERFSFSVVSEAPALGVHCYFMWRPSHQK